MILCCGEALIDFLPVKTANGADSFQPFNGGSVYNTAIALGRLGCNVGFFGGLSNDFFGSMLADGLEASRVDISFSVKSPRPTTLAFVSFNDGQPEYAFLDNGSAGRMLVGDDVPDIRQPITALHFGSISLINDPAGNTFEQMAVEKSEGRIISIDPNIRPSLIENREAYMARLERMFGVAGIIKMSDEDIAWLQPDTTPDAHAARWLDKGSSIFVLTRGSDGALAFTRDHTINHAAVEVQVVDTIGAGDAFMAGLLASFENQNLLQPQGIGRLDRQSINNALTFASQVAAINVSRAGANPPWRHELTDRFANQ